MNKMEFTLTEISNLLQVPQHRLIYYCEAKVAIPDKSDAKGRGSSRRFSKLNLLEFLIALTLSEFHVPANFSAKIFVTMRMFVKEVRKQIPNFELLSSLAKANSPQIDLLITNGTRLFFILNPSGASSVVLGGVDLKKDNQEMKLVNIESTTFGNDNRIEFEDLILNVSSGNAFFKLNLTQTAKDLKSMLDKDFKTTNS